MNANMGNSRKVLVVTSNVLPSRGGSAYIMENLAQQFTPKQMAILGELRPLAAPLRDRPGGGPQFHYFRSRFSILGRGQRFFSGLRWRLLRSLVKKICHVAQIEECNYILGVYPEELYCYAAYMAAQQMGVPFSSYFHNTYLDNVAINSDRANRIQPLLFDGSEFIFVMSDGMQRFYEERYELGNCVPLRHTYVDESDGDTLQQPLDSAGDKIRLVLFGTFNESNLDATCRLVQTLASCEEYELHIYTDSPNWLLKLRGVDTSRLINHGFIDDSRLVAELAKYDVVVLTHGFKGTYGEIEYRTIFPTRTIPMLRCGRPILAHSPAGSFLNEFLQEHDCADIIDTPGADAISDTLKKMLNDTKRREQLVTNAQKTALLFEGKRVAQVLKAALNICD